MKVLSKYDTLIDENSFCYFTGLIVFMFKFLKLEKLSFALGLKEEFSSKSILYF